MTRRRVSDLNKIQTTVPY